MRRPSLWTAVVAAGTLLVLALFLAIALRNVGEMRTLRDGSVRIEHTLEVQRSLDAVLIAQSEADADVRAFLLTGSADVLEAVRADQQAAVARLERLVQLVADSPSQLRLVADLRTAAELRRVRLERVIQARQTGTVAAALDEARLADSSAPRDTIRSLISRMEHTESALLIERRAGADQAYARAVRGRVGSSLVSAALLIGIVMVASMHARAKAQREAALVLGEQHARAAAAQAHEARAEAEAANRAKDQFLAVLSHELRTPLNAVLGWTQILQTAGPDDAATSRALAAIRRNAEAQQRLVEDLLDVSRIVTGKLPFERESFDLRAAVLSAVESIRPAAESKGLTLAADLDPTPLAVGDPGRIQQVVSNLLSNAVKFTPAEGNVTVSLRATADLARIEVADTGIGIPADLQPYIFDRFRQGDSSIGRAQGGLGLGLAIARHIVEMHGGTIAVESIADTPGTRFLVSLPYR